MILLQNQSLIGEIFHNEVGYPYLKYDIRTIRPGHFLRHSYIIVIYIFVEIANALGIDPSQLGQIINNRCDFILNHYGIKNGFTLSITSFTSVRLPRNTSITSRLMV